MDKLYLKQSKKRHLKTRTTPASDDKIVYSEAYLQALPQAYPQALPETLYVGDGRCEHSNIFQREDVCLFCFLRDGFQNELPQQIHLGRKNLATNGNPQQAPRFQSHVQVVAGYKPPQPGEPLRTFRLARGQYTKPAHGIFPFSSALWELMKFQPPLAIPLIRSISGEKHPKIAEELQISVYNLQERLYKGVNLTLQFLRA